ncbi:GMC oxidoreductase-domain-containing protein, partial [Lyophyllum atratum]
DPQITALVTSLQLAGLPLLDLNSIAGDGGSGVNSPSATVDENHIRSSVHERLQAVQKSSSGRLHLSLDTLATKLLLCDSPGGVLAYGVQIAPGAALPVASNFAGKIALDIRNVTARHEVIVSAGTFQSPQLLSGIGDQDQLRQHGIESIVNLPGVGNNLQDHDEIPIIWRMQNNYTLFNGCKFLSDPEQDPCLQDWLQSNHKNLYAFSGVIEAVITQSSPNLPGPDILTYFIPASFPGFVRGM